jgi:hypothetical protein
MDSSALRVRILAQDPSGAFAEHHQRACPLLSRRTQGVGHVIHGPVGPSKFSGHRRQPHHA